MEDDDDEFGDLYTDVLLPFTSSSASQPHSAVETAQSLNPPIDLNIKSDNEGRYGAPNSISTFNFANSSQNRALLFDPKKTAAELITAGSSDSSLNLKADDKLKNQELGEEGGLVGLGNNWASDSRGQTDSRVLESGGDVKLQKKAFEDPNLMDDSGIDVVVDERDDKDDVFVGEDEILTGQSENFDIEEVNTGIGDLGSEPVIPGLSITGVSGAAEYQGDVNIATRDEATGEGDDWESDSEDDLQIVLNDNNHIPMPMDRAGVVGTDDDDEDGDPLVIVVDTDVADPNHQQTDEQEWGEDAAQGADGERKESGDAAKVNGVAVAPKIGYNNHGYHPFHSQFKYVRPGAAPMPGSAPVAPGGTVGQVRPPVNMGPMAGRGRGDWRPTGIKSAAPMQKNFHPAFGMPGWGNNTSGRGSGLEFTLPSHKTIFDVEVESFEEKPWRLPGIDISDYFNFSLNEDSWKEYCKQLEQHRLEATMQSKIRVYESGRTEQEYDPDLPPELAAAAGMNEVSSENVNLGKTDAGQSDLTKGPARARPPLPTGRAIQVESGYGERLPSIDTRPPRIRDSDAIIEIVLQDFGDDDSFRGNDVTEKPENDRVGEDVGEHEIEEDIGQDDAKQFDSLSPAYNGKKREPVGRRTPLLNSVCDNISEGVGTVPLHPEAPGEYNPDSREKTPVYRGRNLGNSHEDRRRKGRTPDRSPSNTPSGGTLDRRFCDNQKEGSVESMGVKHSPSLSRSSAGDPGVEHGGSMQDERALADGSSGIEKEEMILNERTDTLKDDNLMNSVKKQKLHSRVEQTCVQEVDDTEDLKAARSSENSRARSGSSRDYQKLHDGIEEEVVQGGRSTRMRNTKRPLCDDEQRVRKQIRDERPEVERHRMAVKGREDSYSRRDRDPNSVHYPNVKTEGIDRLKERDTSDGAWQWRDGDPYGRRTRAEDTKKRERGEEMGSRHRTKARESERGDKDEHLQLRKQLDNGSWRGHHDKDMGSRHRERDDNLRSRYENIDDIHSKRRKEDEHIKREHAEKEEIVHGHRENTTRRKRERDDVLDQWKRDDQARIRDDDHHSVRHKEESWFQREKGDRQRDRDELHMPKQPHEESLSKREREGRGVGIRSVRAAEDKAWVSHARGKDEHKGSDRDYQFKETGRQSEQLKRRDRVEDGSSDRDYQFKETGRQSEQLKRRDRVEDGSSQHRGREDVFARGNQPSNDEKKLRLERATTRSDHAVNISDTHKMNEKKHKGNVRKSKETEGGDNNSLGSSKRIQEDHKGQINETGFLKGASEQENGGQKLTVGHHSSRKHRDDASSDDEQQDSRRGRSKLERWTSHKERDFSIGTKSSSSLKVKEIERHNDAASSLTSKLPDESSKMIESSDHQHPFGNEKDAGNPESKNANAKVMEDKHLDTVAKLKKRSERFKLPMPSEKDAVAVKKMESEPLPSAQIETNADSEVKLERPARRRRWTSN